MGAKYNCVMNCVVAQRMLLIAIKVIMLKILGEAITCRCSPWLRCLPEPMMALPYYVIKCENSCK